MQIPEVLTTLAEEQEGLLTLDQLRTHVTTWQRQHLIASGWARRIAPRVYVIRGAPDTHRQRLRAGLLSLGERSWVSFEAAAHLHGLDRSNRRAVEFTIHRSRRPSTLPFVVHTTKRLTAVDTVSVDGFRVMSASRTIYDLALARVSRQRLEAAIDSAVRLQLSSPHVLLRRLEDLRGSGRWGCLSVAALNEDAGGHSPLERRFLELVRVAGLSRPRTQVVFKDGLRTLARVDFLFDEVDVVVEVSGQRNHASPSERARDAQRRNELQDLGLRVYEYTYAEVMQQPDMVIRTLRIRLAPTPVDPAA